MENREKATVGKFLTAMKSIGWKYQDRALLGGPSYRFWDYKGRATDVWLRARPDSRPRIEIDHRKHPYKVEYYLDELDLITFAEQDSVMLCVGPHDVLFHFYNFDKEKNV